jgi:hypothetical protein
MISDRNTPVDRLPLSARARRVLTTAHITTFWQLADTWQQGGLRRFKGCGVAIYHELELTIILAMGLAANSDSWLAEHNL